MFIVTKTKKVNNYEKLLFTLCRTCAQTKQQNHCNHDDNQRAFFCNWTTDELNKAIDKGTKHYKYMKYGILIKLEMNYSKDIFHDS